MVRKAGLIVNDGKELAVKTASSVQKKLEKSNYEVVRVSSSGGMVGFANPDQHVRPLGYTNCVPEGFDSSMGCGMVDPKVLEKLGIDSEKWTGFAAGLGVERFCMVRHQIDDIRKFYTNDLRFLEQF